MTIQQTIAQCCTGSNPAAPTSPVLGRAYNQSRASSQKKAFWTRKPVTCSHRHREFACELLLLFSQVHKGTDRVLSSAKHGPRAWTGK